MESDSQLVQLALGGDRDAFAKLLARHERTVRAAAMAILGDHHSAQDASQEAFVAAYRKLATLRDGSAFGPWVFKIARREALRIARRSPATVSLDSQADRPDPRDDGRLDSASRRLLEAVMKLPAHERTVVTLRHFDGHSVAEIAEIAARPVGTVTKQLSRAYARLREGLTREARP